MSYEIIVLDLDGTLTNKDKIITPRTKDALMKMQQMGKRVVLASGRPTKGVRHLADELELGSYGGYVLSYNGGMIIDWSTGETVFSRLLPVESNGKIIGLAEEHQVDILTYEGEDIITETPEDPYAQLESRVNSMEIRRIEGTEGLCEFPGAQVPDAGGRGLSGHGGAEGEGGPGEKFQRLPVRALFPGDPSQGN